MNNVSNNHRVTPTTQPTAHAIDKARWKQRTYLTGGLLGLIGGIIGAYLFARAAEEEIDRTGVPTKISSAQILGLSLAALGLIRQITDIGKPPQGKK